MVLVTNQNKEIGFKIKIYLNHGVKAKQDILL